MRIRDAIGLLLRTVANAVDHGGPHVDVANAAYDAGKAIGIADERARRLAFDSDEDHVVMQAAMDQVDATSAALDRAVGR